MRPNTNLFTVKFRRMLEVIGLQVLQKKFWAHIYDLCFQKRSCLPWSSDAFSKFSACKVHRISSGRIFTIYVSKNEAVCRDIQKHFRSSPLARFAEKVLGAYLRFICPKTKVFAVKFRRIPDVSACNVHRISSGHIFTLYLSKCEAVFRKVLTHFRSSPLARFTE